QLRQHGIRNTGFSGLLIIALSSIRTIPHEDRGPVKHIAQGLPVKLQGLYYGQIHRRHADLMPPNLSVGSKDSAPVSAPCYFFIYFFLKLRHVFNTVLRSCVLPIIEYKPCSPAVAECGSKGFYSLIVLLYGL